jgi:uncharacterized membrane protein YhaH (DUF805 family)
VAVMLDSSASRSQQKGITMEWMLMPLRRYAEFSGRSRRMEYWMFFLFQILINVALYVLMLVVGGSAMMLGADSGGMAALGIGAIIIAILYLIVTVGLIIPALAVGVRRLHDTNRTGWWLLAPLAPYVLLIVGAATEMTAVSVIGVIGVLIAGVAVIVFMFLDGTRGDNKYGHDPKETQHLAQTFG